MVYAALRACAHARQQGIHAAAFHVENCENCVFGWEAVLTIFQVKHVLIQKQAQSLAHVAFRACQDRASVHASMYGNLMHEARSDMFWSWRRFVRVLEEVSGKARISL